MGLDSRVSQWNALCLELELAFEVFDQNCGWYDAMNHVFEKLDRVGAVVEEKMTLAGERADAFLARAETFNGKIDKAFAPHEAALDAGERKLDELETKLDRLSNRPLSASSSASTTSQASGTATDPSKPGA